MIGARTKWMASLLLLAGSLAGLRAQESASLNASGQIAIDGKQTAYLIRRLPVNAFPQLPAAVQNALLARGCLIPQSYEAHGPENVVHASLERAGSSDWAVLCSAKETVSLLVFFSGAQERPATLASAQESSRLQMHNASGILGFNWTIDPASPQTVHEAQLGMKHPPARLEHDALADAVLDGKTLYRYYGQSGWRLIETTD
jgi:hypothetical protein